MHALLISVIMLVGLCLASSNPDEKSVDTVDLDIVQAVAGADFNSLLNGIRVAGLAGTLDGDGPFTLFAPKDAAFAKIPEGELAALMANETMISEVLTYHVVPGKVMSANLSNGMILPTLQGENLTVTIIDNSPVMINDAKVVQPDMVVKNGVIHFIDTVLIPATAGDKASQEAQQDAAQEAQEGNVTASNLDGVFWTLDSLLNSEGETVSVLPNTEVTTLFQDGRISGNAGCNNYAAEYESIGYNLTIGPITSTLMMCDENISNQETDFLSDLGNAASYSISGNQLRIMNSSEAVILSYSAAQPMPLVGTLWQMTSYNNGMGGLVSAQANINTTALFGKDGSLEGFAGCNQYHAAYQTNDSQIKIGPTATTRMACEETVMEMEMDYLNALQSAASYEVQAGDLTLFDANDTKAVTFKSMRIVETAMAGGNFSTLVSAIQKAGLVDTLNGEGPFTVFAPNDEAFAKIPEEELAALMANKTMLSEVLTYHVVSGKVMSADLSDGMTVPTVQGENLTITITEDDTVMINDAKVVQADMVVKNGVIHFIDTVLMP